MQDTPVNELPSTLRGTGIGIYRIHSSHVRAIPVRPRYASEFSVPGATAEGEGAAIAYLSFDDAQDLQSEHGSTVRVVRIGDA